MIRLVAWLSLALACACTQARVTRIVIDETVAEPVLAGGIAYEQVAGRAFGELDPKHVSNAIIQDIELAKEGDGKVRYVASFVLIKPANMAQASGLMWHDVPNRGRVFAFAPQERLPSGAFVGTFEPFREISRGSFPRLGKTDTPDEDELFGIFRGVPFFERGSAVSHLPAQIAISVLRIVRPSK